MSAISRARKNTGTRIPAERGRRHCRITLGRPKDQLYYIMTKTHEFGINLPAIRAWGGK
jgi:hypothetical protein